MSIVITRLFDSYDQASQAVSELEAGGLRHDDVSLVANNADEVHQAPPYSPTGATAHDDTAAEAGTGAGTGATIGTVLGGGAGLLAGLGMLAIPGIGPVVAAGWLVATAVGAGVGAGAGGLLGSLVGAGVSEADANVYSEGVRRGGTLVTVRADEGQRAMIESVLARHHGVDADTRGAEYRSAGWERFDETAPAYAAGATPTLGAVPPTLDPLPPTLDTPGVAPTLPPRPRATTDL